MKGGGYDSAFMQTLYTQSPALAFNINTRAKWTISQLYHGRETHRRWMPASPYAYKKEIKMQLVPEWKTESEGCWENSTQ